MACYILSESAFQGRFAWLARAACWWATARWKDHGTHGSRESRSTARRKNAKQLQPTGRRVPPAIASSVLLDLAKAVAKRNRHPSSSGFWGRPLESRIRSGANQNGPEVVASRFRAPSPISMEPVEADRLYLDRQPFTFSHHEKKPRPLMRN